MNKITQAASSLLSAYRAWTNGGPDDVDLHADTLANLLLQEATAPRMLDHCAECGYKYLANETDLFTCPGCGHRRRAAYKGEADDPEGLLYSEAGFRIIRSRDGSGWAYAIADAYPIERSEYGQRFDTRREAANAARRHIGRLVGRRPSAYAAEYASNQDEIRALKEIIVEMHEVYVLLRDRKECSGCARLREAEADRDKGYAQSNQWKNEALAARAGRPMTNKPGVPWTPGQRDALIEFIDEHRERLFELIR
jgi:DNA-directed RNA polymerase subunit RPC12/RpoP